MIELDRWVPDDLWDLVEPLLPPEPPKPKGGRPRADPRAVFATVLYVAVTGACWRSVDRLFGVDDATCHRYFTAWTKAGVWTRLHRLALDQLGARGLLDWSRACVDSQHVRAKRGEPTPAPVR